MEQQPRVGIAGPKILNPDKTLQPCCRDFPTIRNNLNQALGLHRLFPKSAFFSDSFMTYWPHDKIQSVDVLSGCFWMARREAINQVGLLDENFFIYGEDIDWCRRFHQTGWDVKFFPESQAVHFSAASSCNAPITFYIEMQKADLYYWKKHHGNIGKITYSIIIIFRHLLRTATRTFQYIIHPSKITLFKLKRSLYCILWMLHIRKKITAKMVSV